MISKLSRKPFEEKNEHHHLHHWLYRGRWNHPEIFWTLLSQLHKFYSGSSNGSHITEGAQDAHQSWMGTLSALSFLDQKSHLKYPEFIEILFKKTYFNRTRSLL